MEFRVSGVGFRITGFEFQGFVFRVCLDVGFTLWMLDQGARFGV